MIRKSTLRRVIREELKSYLNEGRPKKMNETDPVSPEDLMKGAMADTKALASIGINVKPKTASFTGGPNWLIGRHGKYNIQIKRYNNSSQHGINNGRISVLWISDGRKDLANYDRGWDVKPKDPEIKKLVDQIVGVLK